MYIYLYACKYFMYCSFSIYVPYIYIDMYKCINARGTPFRYVYTGGRKHHLAGRTESR